MRRFVCFTGAIGALWLLGALTPVAANAASTVSVPGTADIFGAGLTTPPGLAGDPGPGTGGGTLPPELNGVTPGEIVTFPSVTGAVFCDSSMAVTATANGPCGGNSSATSLNPVGPISGIADAESNDFLTGVFVGAGAPVGQPPASLDFSSSALGTGYTNLSPQLDQTFFIGNGHTSSGALHRITAPAGATRLFLGVADGYDFEGDPGYYDDDGGAYHVTVDLGTTATPPAAALATSATSGVSNGSNVKVTLSCKSTIACDGAAAITAKGITIALGAFKISPRGSKKLSIVLTTAGKRLLIKDHGHLQASILVAVQTAAGIKQARHSLSISGRP